MTEKHLCASMDEPFVVCIPFLIYSLLYRISITNIGFKISEEYLRELERAQTVGRQTNGMH